MNNFRKDQLGPSVPRSQIIVLGMHRSGTSVATALLGRMGAFVGERDKLTEPNEENPLGFMERRDVRRICDALLHAADADWWKIADFDLRAVDHSVFEDQRRALESLVKELDRHGTWALKEPRLCLLLPLVRPMLTNPAVVFVTRNPVEVARSLYHRNGFPIDFGLALWEAYVTRALHHSAALPCVYVDYSEIVDNADLAASRLLSELAKAGIVGLRAGRVRDVVDRNLYRQRAEPDWLATMATPAQRRLWNELRGAGEARPPVRPVSESTRVLLREFDSSQYSRS